MAIQHSWADAWLLHAILLSGGGGPTDLKSVFKAADVLQHSSFTPTELRYCAARLEAGGFVRYVDGSFGPTPKARAEWQRLTGLQLRFHEMQRELESLLGASGWHPDYDPNRGDPELQPAPITDEQLDAAMDAYRFPFS